MQAIGFVDCFNKEGVYELGYAVEVTQLDVDKAIQKLAISVRADSIRTSYILPNVLCFTTDSKNVALGYNNHIPVLTLGQRGGGFIVPTATFSFNGLYDSDNKFMCLASYVETCLKSIKLIALGERDDYLVGVWVARPMKGVFLLCNNKCYSTCSGIEVEKPEGAYVELGLEDWLKHARIRRVKLSGTGV